LSFVQKRAVPNAARVLQVQVSISDNKEIQLGGNYELVEEGRVYDPYYRSALVQDAEGDAGKWETMNEVGGTVLRSRSARGQY